MPIFKVSIFKTSFLTGNPWNFLQKTHQVGNHPTVSWTWKMQTPSCSTCFFGCTKTFYGFFKKNVSTKTISSYNGATGLRGRPVTLTLPCHDRKWQGTDFQCQPVEIRSFSQTSKSKLSWESRAFYGQISGRSKKIQADHAYLFVGWGPTPPQTQTKSRVFMAQKTQGNSICAVIHDVWKHIWSTENVSLWEEQSSSKSNVNKSVAKKYPWFVADVTWTACIGVDLVILPCYTGEILGSASSSALSSFSWCFPTGQLEMTCFGQCLRTSPS